MEMGEASADEVVRLLGVDRDDVSSMTPGERNEFVVKMERLASLTKGLLMSELGSASIDRTTSLTKASSISHYVADKNRCQQSGHGGLSALEKSAVRLQRHMPEAMDLLQDGLISADHACALARVLAQRPFRDALIRDTEMVLRWAQNQSWSEFGLRMEAWSTLNDTRDPADLDRLALDNRGLDLTGIGGERLTVISSPTECADQLMSALQPITDRMFDEDWEAARAATELKTEVDKSDLVRTDSQRRHDAFMELIRKGAAANGTNLGVAPVVLVGVDIATLSHQFDVHTHQMSGAPGPAPTRVVTEQDIIDYRCETFSGMSITPTSAFRTAMAGHIRAHLTSHGRFMGTTSKSRLFTGEMRVGIMFTERLCNGPRCETRAHHCEIDHTIPHSQGGKTEPDNGKARCSCCHSHKTRLEALGYNYNDLN